MQCIGFNLLQYTIVHFIVYTNFISPYEVIVKIFLMDH